MRLPAVNCILLACIATAMAANESRPKRDLLYLKNLLTSTLFGSSQDTTHESAPVLIRQDGDVKIFRIPGFNNILVRAVPKNLAKTQAQAAEEIRVIENPTLGVLESYLGTKTQGQTLAALQGIKNLLKSGILNAQRDLLEILPVEEPCKTPLTVIQGRPNVPLFPILSPLLPVSPLQTEYSYQQTGVDGQVTTYSSTDGEDVIVMNEPLPLPPAYILNRLQDIVFYSRMKPVPALTRVVIPKPTKPVFVPPVQTIVETPNVDVEVSPGSMTTSSGSEAVHEQIPTVLKSVSGPLPYVDDGIERVSASALSTNLPEAPSGYGFKMVNNVGAGPHIHQTLDIYKQMYPNGPLTVAGVEDIPKFDTKGDLHFNVNNGHTTGNYGPNFLNSGRFYYNQRHPDGTVTTYSRDKDGRISVSVVPFKMLDTIDKVAATGHAAQMPKPSGYSFKIVNNEAFMNNNQAGFVGVENQAATGSGTYSYKQINNDGTSTNYVNTDEGMRSNSVFLEKETNKAKPGPSGYSFKIVNNQASQFGGNIPEQTQQNMGSFHLSLGAAEANLGEKSSSPESYSYKQVHNDGTSSMFMGSDAGKKVHSVVLVSQTNKNIPAPPAFIVDRIEKVAAQSAQAQAEKPSSEYSFKLVNGQESQVSGNTPDQRQQNTGSLLLSPSAAEANLGEKSAISGSYSYKQINNAGSFTTYLGSDEGINENSVILVSETNNDMPAPPAFIVDRTEKVAAQAQSADKASSGYSFKLINNQVSNYGGSTPVQKQQNIGMTSQADSGSFSYKQISDDGTSTTFVGSDLDKTGDSVVLVSETKKDIPAPPAFIVDRIEKVATQERIEETASNAHEAQNSGYSFKLVNNQASTSNVDGQIQQTVKKSSANEANNYGILPGSGAYSYRQIHNAGTPIHVENDEEKKENSADLVTDTNNEDGQSGYAFNKDGTSGHQTVLFTAPVSSRYIYKQTNSDNPKPLTFVRVEDEPTFETNSDVIVSVNMHEHINPDGTRYLCDQKHVLPVPNLVKYVETVPDLQSGFVLVPPTEETKIVEQVHEETDFSLEQGGENSLSKKPIVVAPEEHIYSYKQSATDGSSMSIQGESQKAVSVSVNESGNTESHRGDIP